MKKMKIVIVSKIESEFAREIEEWARDYKYETGQDVEQLDPDSIDGQMFAVAHDVTQYPTVLVLKDDGAVVRKWSGLPLPKFDNVSYYVGH